MSELTPGVWGVLSGPRVIRIVTPPPEITGAILREGKFPNTSRRIALLEESAYVSLEECEANARLMAASKELLAVIGAYAKWEVGVISRNLAAGGDGIWLTLEEISRLLDIQAMRTAALGKVMGAK